jgi:1-phosphofructokinase family hexose kinase
MIYTITLNPTIDRTIHFPQLQVGELNRALYSRTDLSGKGVNVSVALRRFGLESVMLGFVAGIYGQVLQQGLCDKGYACDFCRVEGETRSNVTVIDRASGITTKLNESGPTVTAEGLKALQDKLLSRVEAGDVCIFSGSLPPGPGEDTYARLITDVKERGATAVLDTSGPALAEGCRAAPDFIKPNDVEAHNLVGMSLDGNEALVATLEAMLALGPRRVLLSLGSRGAAYADQRTAWLAKPPMIQEMSAVGAGDALMAAGLWAWMEDKTPQEIVRWATASGTATAMKDGTVIPTLEEIKEVYTEVHLIRLK